jgi:DNA-directed RNA polymerase subunit RPC12/RpoP
MATVTDCPICYDASDDRKETLECGHWCCSKCWTQIVQHTRGSEIACWMCRRSTLLPGKSQDVDGPRDQAKNPEEWRSFFAFLSGDRPTMSYAEARMRWG